MSGQATGKTCQTFRPTGSSLALPAPRLLVAVHTLGFIAFLAYSALAAMSYVHAAALWRTQSAPRAQAFFDVLSERVRPASARAAAWLASGTWPADNVWILTQHALVLCVPTVALLLVLGLLARCGHAADATTLGALRRWAVAFAVVSVAAYPVFTQDFWLSALWGRMIAAGDNPYHRPFTEADVAALPLDHFAMPMSYGPLWGLVSAAVMLLTSGSRLMVAAIAFKLVLLGLWLACLAAIGRLTDRLGDADRCRAIAIFGWAPAGVSQTVAEGHNDVAMVVMMLLWLLLLAQHRWQAPIALAASVLCKFASAPLALVEAIELLRKESLWYRRLARIAAPTLLGLAVMALFYRSPNFFDGIFLINEWHFLQPRDAVAAIGQAIGLSMTPVAGIVTLAFPTLAAYRLLVSYRQPSFDNQLKAALAIMAATLFAALAHIWAWYLIWGLALAVLVPSWWLARFVVAVSLLIPFTLATWWIEGLDSRRDLVALALYILAGLWCAAPLLLERSRRVSATTSSCGDPIRQAHP